MNLRQITAPTIRPVTLEEAKAHLGVESLDFDAQINRLIDAIVSWMASPYGWLNRSLCRQTLEFRVAGWPSAEGVHLPGGPVASVSSVKYFDTANVEQTVSSADYFLDLDRLLMLPGFTKPILMQRPAPIAIRYLAGAETAAEVPEGLREAVLLMLERLWNTKGAMVPSSLREDSIPDVILSPFRQWII